MNAVRRVQLSKYKNMLLPTPVWFRVIPPGRDLSVSPEEKKNKTKQSKWLTWKQHVNMWRCIETLDVCLVFFLSHEPAFYLFLFSFRWPTESWLLTPLTYLISLCNRKIQINYIFIWINGQLQAYQDQSWLIVIAINQDSFRLININQHSYMLPVYQNCGSRPVSRRLSSFLQNSPSMRKRQTRTSSGNSGKCTTEWLTAVNQSDFSFFFFCFLRETCETELRMWLITGHCWLDQFNFPHGGCVAHCDFSVDFSEYKHTVHGQI